jgi:Signal transduction histidine kinase involved in nitrogen fixation and metabolism regulation
LSNVEKGKPFWYSNAYEKKTYRLVKLNNFDNLYLYVVKNVDKEIVNFLKDTGDASTYYYKLKTNIKKLQIVFLIIYITITLLLVFTAVLVAINFSSRINRPLNKIFHASKEISKGNYNINLPNDKNQDFNVLNLTFTEMSKKIKEQEQKSKLTGRFEAWEIVEKNLGMK